MLRAAVEEAREVDTGALSKYGIAIGVQMAAIAAFLSAVDAGLSAVGLEAQAIPQPAVVLFFIGLALKSRVFSPLNNQRPDLEKAVKGEESKGFNDRTMPSWTPPGVTFPIMWVLIVAPLRAFSTSLVLASPASSGHFCDPTILALMLHLSIGDTWNTINNTERRLGAAVPGVFCVWLSVLNAARAYGEVDATAGNCLALTAVWITVAGLPIADTWRINNPDGDRPLYPFVGEAETAFSFEN